MRRLTGQLLFLVIGLVLTATAIAQKPDEKPGVVSFLVVPGAMQGPDEGGAMLDLAAKTASLKNKPTFIAVLGNLTRTGSLAEYAALRPGLKQLTDAGITLRALPGSRDVSADADGKEQFQRTFSRLHESFDLNSAHFILLDTTAALHSLGHIDKPQIDWLDKDLKRLKPETPIFLFMYHSITSRSPGVRPLDNQSEVLSRLKTRNVVAVFSGDGEGETAGPINGLNLYSVGAGRRAYLVTLSQLLAGVDSIDLASGKITRVAGLATALKKNGSTMRVVWDDPDIPFLERRRPAATLSPRAVADNPDKERAVYRLDDAEWKPLLKDRRDIWSDTFFTKPISIGIHSADIMLTTSNDSRYMDEIIFEVERDNKEPTRKWALDLPSAIQSSPVLSGDTLYVTCNDGKLYALNIENGKKRWIFPGKSAFIASPLVSNGTVYIGSTDGSFYAVEASTGHGKWKNDLTSGVLGAAAVSHGVVCIPTANGVFGLDILNGSPRWSHPDEAPMTADVPSDPDAFYVTNTEGKLAALDAVSGGERWHLMLGAPCSAPCMRNGKLYVTAGDGKLHCIDAVAGREEWAKSLPGDAASYGGCAPLACGGYIVTASANSSGAISGFDAASGSSLWQFSAGQPVCSSTLKVGPDGRSLALMTVRGHVIVLDAVAGKRLWGYELGPGNIYSTPEYDGKMVFTTTMDNDVQAINGPGVLK